MDFITGLPETPEGAETCLVLTDRLSKGALFFPLVDSSAEAVVEVFLQGYYPHHGLPDAIVSDRGPQFISQFWKRLCECLNITRRLSTAYHPETDGATERMNQTLEAYLSAFCAYAQDDWAKLLPAASLAVNTRPSASTGLSPFFLTHGYEFDPIRTDEIEFSEASPKASPVARADLIVQRLKQATEWAQAAMAVAQEKQQAYANKARQQAYSFHAGDKVWLRDGHRTNLPNLRPFEYIISEQGLISNESSEQGAIRSE